MTSRALPMQSRLGPLLFEAVAFKHDRGPAAADMFKDKLPPSKLPPAKLPTAAQVAAASHSTLSSAASSTSAPTPQTLALHAVSFPSTAPPSTLEVVTNAASFAEVCDAAALVRARCRTPLPGRQSGSCYCGRQDGDGLPHGHGLLCLSDGSFYFGALQRGQRHGLGVAVMPAALVAEGGGLPFLSNIGHPVYHTPSPHAVAAALCASSSLPSAASTALLQLKQLRVSLEDLQACAYRHWHALCCTPNCNTS